MTAEVLAGAGKRAGAGWTRSGELALALTNLARPSSKPWATGPQPPERASTMRTITELAGRYRGPRGHCSVCGKVYALRADGTLRTHRSDRADTWYCPGAGKAPARLERERAAKAGRG
jgi:hypothetical protein